MCGTFSSVSVKYVRKVSNDEVSTAIAGIGMAADGFSQIFLWGLLIDSKKVGVKKTMFILQGFLLFFVAFYAYLSTLSVVAYALFYICIMVCYAGVIPLFINIAKSVYGEANSGFVFACLES
jgi:hypothetical protein